MIRNEEIIKRNEEIRRLKENGISVSEIAKKLNISSARVYQICKEKKDNKDTFGLSKHTYNALVRYLGCELTKEKIFSALENGIEVYMLGKKGLNELSDLFDRKVIVIGKKICGLENLSRGGNIWYKTIIKFAEVIE